MNATYYDFWVTVRTSESSTQDFKVTSHSVHGAQAQYRQKNPNARIIRVRYCERKPSNPPI
jgi:hypothetical protein